MRIKIANKYWNLKFVPNLGPNDGICEHPDTPNRTIKIQKGMDSKAEGTVIIHELLHAASFDLYSEEYVDQLSSDIMEVLWKLGYRKVGNGKNKDQSDRSNSG